MPDKCTECGEQTIWEEDLGSAVCPHCGTLANPAQNILASHLEHVDTSGRDYYQLNHTRSGALKGRNGRPLTGQDSKEARDRRNTIAIHEFIRSLASKLSRPGYVARAQGIFDQAMAKGRLRWGRKAKLTAGAALGVALREGHKNDSLRDIAYLLDEPLATLTRTFKTITGLLHLNVTAADPAQYLQVLETHLRSLLVTPPTPPLPTQLESSLASLLPKFAAVQRTASSLSLLSTRIPNLSSLPVAPTACALLILALEGELAVSLANAGFLAGALGARVGASKTVVMQRYKIFYDAIEQLIQEVPWLEAHQRKTTANGKGKGRSKVAKRVVVAKGLKDVVLFQEEIWRKKLEAVRKPVIDLEEDDTEDGSSAGGTSTTSSEPIGNRGDVHLCSQPQAKRRKPTAHEHQLADVSRFLLNPLSRCSTPGSSNVSNSGLDGRQDLLEHLLIADTIELGHAFRHPPTRLQLLAAARGGSGENIITDEELFEEGELEGLLRTPQEAEAVRIIMGWTEEDVTHVLDVSSSLKGKKRKRHSGEMEADGEKEQKRSRINMAVLEKLLDPNGSTFHDDDIPTSMTGDEDGSNFHSFYNLYDQDSSGQVESHESLETEGLQEHGESYGEGAEGKGEFGVSSKTPYREDDEEEVLEEWRPLSPGGGGGFSEDWYEF